MQQRREVARVVPPLRRTDAHAHILRLRTEPTSGEDRVAFELVVTFFTNPQQIDVQRYTRPPEAE